MREVQERFACLRELPALTDAHQINGAFMAYLIPAGAIITLLGVAGLLWCILKVNRARNSGASDEELRDVLQSTMAPNLGALFFSAIGLAMVVVGILLS